MMSLVSKDRSIKLADLEKITNHFSDDFKVGSGRYGDVYRGVYNGQEIAMKKFHPQRGLDNKAFKSELNNLRIVNHQNIVQLIGYCYESKFKFLMNLVRAQQMELVLCFEYMEGGSLDKHINDNYCDLDWPTCYKIIRGTCEGLNHLHNSQEKPIFHLDLRPAKILLDKNLTAKIGDLGSSRLVLASLQTDATNIITGTYEYLPPEYISSGFISQKFDVFSLGVTILKIVAGNEGYYLSYEMHPKQFAELVINNWKERLQSTSGHSSEEIDILRVEACVNMALRCLDSDRYRRPSIKDIVNELEELEEQLPVQIEVTGDLLVKNIGLVSANIEEEQASISEEQCIPNGSSQEVDKVFVMPTSQRIPVQSYQRSFGENYSLESHPHSLSSASEKFVTEDVYILPIKEAVGGVDNVHMEFDLLESVLGGKESPRKFKLQFLQSITKNFSEELKIGSGGCGDVYKGILPNLQIIAVKRQKKKTVEEKMFRREVTSLMTVDHKNVVQFLGYCSNTEEEARKEEGKLFIAEDRERLLCFEYLINGSLERYLTDELRGLEWQTRYQIIKGICDGLHYLHIENHIVHMDLKPANILLDSNMLPKITDFGLSRLDNISQTMTSERLVSLGYCAPEYLHLGKMSVKSDIFSLGVIIQVLVTGSKEEPSITQERQVHRKWKHRWNKTAKDELLGYKQVATCLDLVRRCKEKNPTDRPDIRDIISCLNEVDTECLELKDMLGVEPLEIHLPFELNKQMSCSVEVTNDTDDHFAFIILTTSLRPYCIKPKEDIVPPRSKCIVTISLLQVPHKPLQGDQCMDDFCVRSTSVDGSLAATNIGRDFFNEQPGKVIDTVSFSVVLIEASSPSADH